MLREKSQDESTDAQHRDGRFRSSDEASVMEVERRKALGQCESKGQPHRGRNPLNQTKPFAIPKTLVVQAYKRVKANKGSSGVDGQTLYQFDQHLKGNCYKLWNRLSSGSYHPPHVKRVDLRKSCGGVRPLGIPTVSDRIAQMVVKLIVEPSLERLFHPDSYGYRPNKSAHQALKKTEVRCRENAWVLDMDIQGFFDNIDHRLLMKAVDKHVPEAWIKRYIHRWLTAPVQHPDGRVEARTKGTPQGGVISPLLANLYLHYVFDQWMTKHHPDIQFERYADDIVCHLRHERMGHQLKAELEARFVACGLRLHPDKTKLVYCKNKWRKVEYPIICFDFLGYTFGPKVMKKRSGKRALYFVATISRKAAKHIRDQIREWPWRVWIHRELDEIRSHSEHRLRGWLNYFSLFGVHYVRNILFYFDTRLRKWAKEKYKLFQTVMQAASYINEMRKSTPTLFAHW